MATAPFKVMAAPRSIYIAKAGAADPGLDAYPSAATWSLFADTTAIMEGGVKTSLKPEYLQHYTDGSISLRKVWRSKQEITMEFTIDETGLDNLALILDNNLIPVAAGTGTVGYVKTAFQQGRDVMTHAFYFLGESTRYAGGRAYYYVPSAYFAQTTEIVDSKTVVRGYKVELMVVAWESSPAGDAMGYAVEQTTAPG